MLLTPLVRRTLAPRGQTPKLFHRGRHRQKVSLIAALSLSPKRGRLGLHFQTAVDHYFKQENVAAFVRQVLRHFRGPVILVWDRWSGHRGDAIRAVQADHPRLQLVDLPAYAPQLNPVEQLWSYLKWSALSNYSPNDVVELNDTIVPVLQATARDKTRKLSYWKAARLHRGLGH